MTATEKAKPFRVLSLDGGGIRGLNTATVLDSLSKRYSLKDPLDIGSAFDLIVGTSTGGILAAALAYGIPVCDVARIYSESGKKIFTDPQPKGKFKFLWWALKNTFTSANKNADLKDILDELFEGKNVEQLWNERKIGLCLTSVDLSNHTPRVFKTPHFKNKNLDNKRKLSEICLASAAAPTYFPIAKLEHPDGNKIDSFIDGGLWANNPVLIGLAEALHLCGDRDVEIISIGTRAAIVGKMIPAEISDVGIWFWRGGTKPLHASMDAQANGHFYTAKFIADGISKLGKRCVIQRLHQEPPSGEQMEHLDLDNVDPVAITTLVNLAVRDAELINGMINNKTENYEILGRIFESMPKLKKGATGGKSK